MNPKILKNPTGKVIEFSYDSRVFTFQPGETKAIEGGAAALALEFDNTHLIEVETVHTVTTVTQGPSYTDMGLPQLLKLAKSRGIKTKFGMKKIDVIDVLVNSGINE